MKTWEMMKALQENESKEFKSDNCGGTLIAKIDCGLFCTHNNGGYAQSVFDINRKWEEVKQPVTWQEAIAHHIECVMSRKQTENKNSFKVEMRSAVYFQSKMLKLGCFSVVHENIQSKSNGIDAKMLENGKWYILD